MPDISSYLKKARQMDEEKGVAYKATPSTSTNSGAYTPSKSGVDISNYLKKAREMDANNATVSMPNANSQQNDERKQQEYLSYLAGLDLDAQKKKAEDLDKLAKTSRVTNYFADAPQDSNPLYRHPAGYFDVAPETYQVSQKTKEEAEADLAWKDYNLAKSLQYQISGDKALSELNADVYTDVDKLAQAWLSPDIYNTIAQGSTERLRSAGYTDAEIEQLVDYRKRQINRSEYDEKVAKTEELANNGFWGAAGASVASVPQQVLSGAGYIDLALQKLQNAYSGNDRPLDYYTQAMSFYGQSNAARSTVTQNIEDNAKTELGGKIGSFLYNTGMSMADFISVSPLGGAGMALLGSGAATATAVDIRDRGGDDTQALLGGALAGAAEAVFENESLKSLFALSKPVAKETLRSGFKRVLKNVAKQGWEEGKEELFTSLANAMTDRMVMGELSSYNTAVRDYMANGLSAEEAERKATLDFIVQCATDTLAGFVSGGVMGGVSTAARGYANYSSYDAKDLVDEALEINPDNAYAQGIKAKLDEGKRVGVVARYKLVQQNESAMREQDKEAIQNAAAEQLTALGEDGDVQAIAAAIAKQTAGEKLDKSEKAAIKDSEHGAAVAEDLNPDNTAEWARQISTNKVNRDAYNADLEALAEEVVSEKQQADAEVSKASEIGSQRLAANDQVYQTASKMFGEDKAFAVAAAYRSGANGLSAGEFLTGFAAAHQSGVNGTSLKKTLAAQSNLRPEQVKIAWSLGNDERTSRIEVRNVKRQGTGTFADKSTGKATDSWQAFTTVLEGIAKRTGIDIETVDAIKAGSQTANGKMVRDMMTLVLSRNAENNMQSLGHELGEFVEAFNPEDMASLRVDILRYWAKTQSATSVDKMVKAYQGTYKQAEGGKTYEQAESEAINDALGAILASDEGVDALMEWLQSDSGMNADEQKTFLQKLADLFQSIVNALKKLLNSGNLTPMQQDMVHMEIEQKQDILKRLFAAVDQAALNAKETGEYYADITLAEAGIAIDRETDSAHSLQFSTAYTDVVKVGKKNFDTEAIVKLVAEGTGRSVADARKWVNSELTIANIVMQNPEFLDFEGDDRYTAIKNNSDYPQGTVDLSNLCPKREEFTTMFDMLQKKYPDKLFTAADVAEMRAILKKNNITVACGACFVEDRRQLLGEIADTYINMWKDAIASGDTLQKVNAEGKKVPLYVTKAIAKKYGLQAGAKILATDTYVPTQYDLTTYEGFKMLQKEHPIIAMGFERYNNSRGQQAARLIEGRAEYDRQILGWSPAKVKRVNNSGGLRIFSFSDFEVVHLLDLVQVIMDCAAMGVKIQGYTKIPAFARLVRDTGIKLNRSLIPKGDTGIKVVNGKRVLDIDTVEGIDINDENFMDESDNPNVGNIIIGINPEQIGIAMLDDFVDYIIPFHSNKSKDILRKLGTGAWVNYKESQHEKDIATGKASKHNVNIYTQVLAKYKPKNKVEFVNAFLKECKAQGKIPRYAEFLNVDENGDYAYREGYHKLLVDFKMFDREGNLLPQNNIQPALDDAFMAKLLADEVTRKKNYKFPDAVYKAIDKKFGDAALSLPVEPRKYSYEWFVAKPDMAVTSVVDTVPKSRADVVAQAKKNAAAIGKTNKDGSVSVHVKDIGKDVILATHGLRHGLDRRLDVNAPVTLRAGEILQNSICVNELTPKRDDASGSYVLIGVARGRDSNLLIVESVVNEFTSELLSMDVLYSMNAKKELAALNAPRLAVKPLSVTSSAISIADLLDYVKVYFPDILPESVLRHYGYDSRPSGNLGEDALFSLPVDSTSMTEMTNREILVAAAEQVDTTEFTNGERDALRIFNSRLDKLGELQSKRKELGELYREQMFVKGKVDRVKAANTRSRMNTLDEQISKAENDVLKAESTEVLKQVLKQARKVVANEQRARDDNTLQRYKERRDNAAAAKKYRERIQKKSMKLTEMLVRNSDKQHIPEQLKSAVGEFLTSIDFTSKRQLRGGEATEKDLRYTDTLNKLRRVLQNQVNYMEDPENSDGLGVYLDMPDEFVQAIDQHIESVGNTLRNTDVATGAINAMTADELKDLDFFLTVLTSSISKVNTFIANGRYQYVSNAAMDAIAYLNEMKEFGGKHTKVDKFLNWDNTTPAYAFKRFGDAGSAIFEGLQDGWDKLAFNSKQVIDFAQETYTEKEVKEWSEKIHDIDLDGRTAKMTTAQIMSLYCLVKREQARGHLFGGGMRIGNIEIKATVEKGKVKSKQDLQQAESFRLTMEDVARITNLLTERQVAVADALQKYMNTVGSKWGNEISFSRFGYNSFTEENYFPIESDRNNLPAVDPETRANDLFRLLNMCFTKGLTPKANNALVVNNIFDVFAAHMSDMAKYNALALPVLDAMKFYNFKDSTKQESGQLTTATVQKAIERAYGGAAKGYFIQFMKDLNGVHDGGRNESESFAMKMVGNYKVAAVGANLRVAFLQPTSYVRAVAVIDPKYLTKAVTMKPATKEMLEHSGVAVWKSLGFYDTNIGRAVRDQIKGEATVRDKLVEASMSAAALGDKLTWGVLWNACKLECAAKGEKSTEAVAKRFREVVYATQVVDSTMTRSQTMRSNSSMTKMLTSFMSEPTLAYNMLVDSYNTYITLKRKGDKSAWQKCSKAITRSMMAYVASMTAAALAESLFDALRDDDDYETFLEKFWEAFWGDKSGYGGKPVAGNLAADLNLLNKLPIIKDIVSEITGYENTRMDTQWFSSIIDAVDAWKSDTRPLYGKIYKTMQALSRVAGLPVSNLMREVVTIYNNTIGVITGNKLKTYEGSVRTNIKDAMAGGHLTEDEAMRELVNKGEAKDMNEAYFIVKGWGTGDTSRYQDVYDAMLANESIAAAVKELTDHGYEKKDVLSTVKSQIGKWYNGTDDKPSSITRQQALSMLVKYGELTRDEANSKLNTWDSQKNQ